MEKHYLNFNNSEEGKKRLQAHKDLYHSMVGTLYPPIVRQEIVEIIERIHELEVMERRGAISVYPILEQYYYKTN